MVSLGLRFIIALRISMNDYFGARREPDTKFHFALKVVIELQLTDLCFFVHCSFYVRLRIRNKDTLGETVSLQESLRVQ